MASANQELGALTLRTRIASAAAGALLTSLVTNPMDVVKTRMQAGGAPHAALAPRGGAHVSAGAGTAASALPRFVPASAVGTLLRVVRLEGMGVLWSGLAPALVMAIPSTTVYFSVYDELKLWLQRRGAGTRLADAAPLLAGVAGRTVTVALVSPLELLRTRAMHRRAALSDGMLRAWRDEVRAGGVRSLWRGLGPTLWRDVPFSGFYWMGYERLKGAFGASAWGGGGGGGGGDPRTLRQTFAVSFAAGVLSGAFAATVTTPFDVIKTRRQVFAGAGAAPPVGGLAAGAAPHTLTLLAELWRREGAAGLFSGLPARVAKVAPSCAIMISSYELGKAVFARLDGGGGAAAAGDGPPYAPSSAAEYVAD